MKIVLNTENKTISLCSSFSTYLFLYPKSTHPQSFIRSTVHPSAPTQLSTDELPNASITQIPLCSWLLLLDRLLFVPVSQMTVLVSRAEEVSSLSKVHVSISHGFLCCVNIELMTNVYQFLLADWFNMERARAIEHSVLSTCMKLWQSLK